MSVDHSEMHEVECCNSGRQFKSTGILFSSRIPIRKKMIIIEANDIQQAALPA